MRLHYLQHVPFENPGSILVWAEKNQYTVTGTHLYKNEILPNPQEFDWLVIMGGPMNIYEEEQYPWLAAEKNLIKTSIQQGKVILGLCLGAQLIADVIGGKVTKNPQTEIGWFPVHLSEEARKSPLFSFFPPEPVVFEWHGDTFSLLPEEAICIAENEACKNQAFIYKKKIFGFQFHLENTAKIIQALVEHCQNELKPGPYVQPKEEIETHIEYIKQDNQWMFDFLTQLAKMDREGVL